MVLDYAEMGSLSIILKNRKNIDWIETQQMLLGVAKGLETIHNVGLLHRDLHPGNILIHKSGDASIGGLESCAFIEDNSMQHLKGTKYICLITCIDINIDIFSKFPSLKKDLATSLGHSFGDKIDTHIS